jgi:hypothetical protein
MIEERLRQALADPGWEPQTSTVSVPTVLATVSSRRRHRAIAAGVLAPVVTAAVVFGAVAVVDESPSPTPPAQPAPVLLFNEGRLSNGQTMPFTHTDVPPVRTPYGVVAKAGMYGPAPLGILRPDGSWTVLVQQVSSFATDGERIVYTEMPDPSDSREVTLVAAQLSDGVVERSTPLHNVATVNDLVGDTALITVGDGLAGARVWDVATGQMTELADTGVGLAVDPVGDELVANPFESSCVRRYAATGSHDESCVAEGGVVAYAPDSRLAVATVNRNKRILIFRGAQEPSGAIALPPGTEGARQLAWSGDDVAAIIERTGPTQALLCSTASGCTPVGEAADGSFNNLWVIEDLTGTAATERPLVTADCVHFRDLPAEILIACGDGNFLLTKVKYERLAATEQSGTATARVKICEPDCSLGHFVSRPARFRLDRVRSVFGQQIFTRIEVTFTRSGDVQRDYLLPLGCSVRPPHCPAHRPGTG